MHLQSSATGQRLFSTLLALEGSISWLLFTTGNEYSSRRMADKMPTPNNNMCTASEPGFGRRVKYTRLLVAGMSVESSCIRPQFRPKSLRARMCPLDMSFKIHCQTIPFQGWVSLKSLSIIDRISISCLKHSKIDGIEH